MNCGTVFDVSVLLMNGFNPNVVEADGEYCCLFLVFSLTDCRLFFCEKFGPPDAG